MENIDGAAARAALDDIADAERTLRQTPWPTWLYLVNGLALTGLALTPLLGEGRSPAVLALGVLVVAVNLTTGHRMGVPWVLPSSRGFQVGFAMTIFSVVLALAASALTEQAWPVVALAGLAAVCFGAASVAHRRSTGPYGPGAR